MEINGKKATLWRTSSQISDALHKIAEQLNSRFSTDSSQQIVLVGLLNGSYMFLSDLSKLLKFNFRVDFLRVASYHKNAPTDKVQIQNTLKYDLKNCVVILIEDILDSGKTLFQVKNYLHSSGTLEIVTVALVANLNCPEKSLLEKLIYAFEFENRYIVGYGMDSNEFYRNLTDIWYI